MWYSSEELSKSTPHQAPSLNHSLLWVLAAVGPVGQLIFGLRELCKARRTPVSMMSTPTTCTVRIQSLCLRTTPASPIAPNSFRSPGALLFPWRYRQYLAVVEACYRPLGRTDGGVGFRAVQVAADELVRRFLVGSPVLQLGAKQAEEGLRSQAEVSGALPGNPGLDGT